jgi:hypothetical protein
MTQHVRTEYRKHRRATWVGALGVVALLAAVFIPFASGARPATDTFTGNASVCSGTTQATFTVTLTNTSKTQNLGSADLYAPVNLTVADASITSGGGTGSILKPIGVASLNGETRSLIHVRNLQMPGGSTPAAALNISVTATVNNPPGGKQFWYSLAKQANDFNPGDLDTSNSFTNTSGDPYFEVVNCTLGFVTQPPNPWQKGSTASDQGASPVAVALFADGVQQNVTGQTAPTLTSTPAGAGYFDFGAASVAANGLSWTYPDAKPTAAAASGLYTLTATRGAVQSPPSQEFRVSDSVCLKNGPTCDVTSNIGGPQAGLGITGLPSDLAIDFVSGVGSLPCDPWVRAFYKDSNGEHYFPTVKLDFAWDIGMMKVTYRIRNAEWVLTDASRGNNDSEFCVGARHFEHTELNKPKDDGGDPFTGKYGDAAWKCDSGSETCTESEKSFWGVLASVANPSKVKPGGDPAVCAAGTMTPQGSTELWRFWTICIPSDWDWGMGR